MRKASKIFIGLAILIISAVASFNYLSNDQPQVLGITIFATPTATSTPTPTPTNTSTPTPTATPTLIPKPTSTPIPTLTPQPEFTNEQIHGFVEKFAGQYGVDPNVLRHLAVCESGFQQFAENGPYVGLFQFGKPAWVSLRIEMGVDANSDLRFNAEEAVETAAYGLAHGKGYMWPNCKP